MDPSVIVWILLGVLALAVVGVIIWYVRRRAYIKSVTDRGWQFVDHPGLEVVHGYNCPPFGLGENRRVDDMIIGQSSSGLRFEAFEYDSSTYRGGGYLVSIPLPRSLPEFYHLPTKARANGSTGSIIHQDEAVTVVADNPDFGRAALSALGPTLGRFGAVPANLSVDHDRLVGLGAPKPAEELAAYVEALAAGAQALAGPSLQQFSGPAKPPRLSIYRRPNWEFRNRDDSLLAHVRHSGGGSNHRAEGCIISSHPTLPFIALTHRWETTRTVTSTDAQGRTTTRTVTDHHEEEIVEFHPRFTFRPFKVNRGLMGNKVSFEWHEFNQAFTVRSPDPKFASDVFHPRQMEYMMQARPVPFEWDERGVIETGARVDAGTLKHTEQFLEGFFARVPNFVWDGLGYQRPPVAIERG
ncbi:hypothetical protein [Aestuariimicrobium sp. Y1814]|uniref:hypothetical protein n=1 Tax=Aestuariimicrobium sp. Y1814 TaxID=3418742 RepID=UPI003DA72E8A